MLKTILICIVSIILVGCGGSSNKLLQNNRLQYGHINTLVNSSARFHYRQALAFEQRGSIAAAVQQRILLESYLTGGGDRHSNVLAIWNDLQQLTPSSLQILVNNTRTKLLRSWFELGLIFKQYNSTPRQFSEKLLRWQQQYPSHSAELILERQKFNPTKINKIAILLPNKGAYASAAAAIKNGIFAAYYSNKDLKKPSVHYYSTGTGNKTSAVLKAYAAALANNVDCIIGPLTKQAVQVILTNGDSDIPILTLNTVYTNNSVPDRIYQFGLPRENEALLAANLASYKGYKNALLVVPNNSGGRKLQELMREHWLENSDRKLFTETFNNKGDFDLYIQNMLEVTQHKKRNKDLKIISGAAIQSNIRRRKDIDVVFLFAKHNVARQIKPLLNYYYAKNIPVYGISSLYNGAQSRSINKDLNDIY
ncbi:MAG: hypothetical protein COB50_04520, partial [Thiotrichales bacterium]